MLFSAAISATLLSSRIASKTICAFWIADRRFLLGMVFSRKCTLIMPVFVSKFPYPLYYLRRYGGKDDNKALREIIEVGVYLFPEYDALLPALTEIFNGNHTADMLTIYTSSGADPCGELGRGKY